MDEELRSEIFKNAKQLHGVPYLSRYSYLEETLEMERFLHAIAAEQLHGYVLSLFYDSNASACDIETVEGLTASDPEGVRLIRAATDHLSQFHLLGVARHGASFR
jgi:hypothetical protein